MSGHRPVVTLDDEIPRIVSAVSHDLRAPLRHIDAFVSELRAELGDDLTDVASHHVARVLHAVGVMQRRLDSLSAYVQVTKPGPAPAACDVGEVVASVVDDLRDEIERGGAAVEVEALPVVVAERSQLAYVFRELLANAVKFGGDGVVIRVGAEPVDGYWLFAVEDDGEGVRSGSLDVFDLFRRCHDGSTPGCGVGLAAVKRIAVLQGGFVEFESSQGQGATARFGLPVISPDEHVT